MSRNIYNPNEWLTSKDHICQNVPYPTTQKFEYHLLLGRVDNCVVPLYNQHIKKI